MKAGGPNSAKPGDSFLVSLILGGADQLPSTAIWPVLACSCVCVREYTCARAPVGTCVRERLSVHFCVCTHACSYARACVLAPTCVPYWKVRHDAPAAKFRWSPILPSSYAICSRELRRMLPSATPHAPVSKSAYLRLTLVEECFRQLKCALIKVRALISSSPPNTGKLVSSSLINTYKVNPQGPHLFSLHYLNQQNTFYIFPHMA